MGKWREVGLGGESCLLGTGKNPINREAAFAATVQHPNQARSETARRVRASKPESGLQRAQIPRQNPTYVGNYGGYIITLSQRRHGGTAAPPEKVAMLSILS